MLKLMQMKLPQFFFCTLEKFRAVDAIYEEILQGDIAGSEFKRKYRKNFQKYQQTPRTLLSDRIREKLIEMEKISVITIQVLNFFTEMFDPKQGINFTNINILTNDQQQRFSQGQNMQNKFSFMFNTSVTKNILQLIYNKKDQKIERKRLRGFKVVHIIGTPGFGKSSTFFAIKYLNDIRMRYIIKNGCPPDSKLPHNYKMFYIHSDIDEPTLKDIFLSETIKDFGSDQQLSSKMDLVSFLRKLKEIYKQKDLQVLVFADQINSLYNKSVDKRVQYIKMWDKVRTCLSYPCAIFLISSKNNPHVQKQIDPILYIADSTGDQYLKKINLDNLMSPQSRICYTAECLLFELEKYIAKSKAIEFIKQLKQVPFLTHLSIRDIIKNLAEENQFQNYIKLIDDGNFEKVNKKIYQKIYENEDRVKLTKNLKESKLTSQFSKIQDIIVDTQQTQLRNLKNEQLEELKANEIQNESSSQIQNRELIEKSQKLTYSQILGLLMTFFSDTPSYKYNVKAVLKMKDENNNSHTNHISFSTVFRSLQGKSASQVIQTTAMLNYFFIGFGLKDNKYSDCSQKGIIFNFDQQIYEDIKNKIYNEIPPERLRQLKQTHPQLFNLINEHKKGIIFQNVVCSIIQQNLQKIETVYFIIQKQETRIKMMNVKHHPIKLSMDQKQYNSQVNVVSSYIKFIKIQQKKEFQQQYLQKAQEEQRSCYVRTQEKSNSFDFILSKVHQNKVKLFFVDVTIKPDVNDKITKFFTTMPNNINFRHLVKEISQKFESVEICYYVLRPNKEYFKNKNPQPINKYQIDLKIFFNMASNIKNVEYRVGHLIEDFQIFKFHNLQSVSLEWYIIEILYQIDK